MAIAKETDVLVTGVSALDESGGQNVPPDLLVRIADGVLKKKPDLTLMILVAGQTHCAGLVFVPASVTEANRDPDTDEAGLTAPKWLQESGLTLATDEATQKLLVSKAGFLYAYGVVEGCDSTLKTKDELNSRAFAVLRKRNLFQDDESDDEMPEMDW